MRAFLLSIATLLLLGGLCSCEYPEQGYFELAGLDGDGRLVASQLFIVEEYVDDSEMTTGFGLLLPHVDGRQLVSIPMDPTEGFEARGWIVRTNARQTGHGNLLLEMTHIAERLKLQGSLHVAGRESAEEFHATLRSDEDATAILFVGGAPPLPEAFRGAVNWELRRLDEDVFEARTGLSLSSPRVPLQPWDMYEEDGSLAAEQSAARSEPGPDRGQPVDKPRP
ncbi:hypothetical protein KDL44_04750 [bacterium]|nr:hypothetical protein [bacterium]